MGHRDGWTRLAGASAPEHTMAASRQGVGHCLFGRFRFPARSELADPFHQVVPQADAKPMRLPCGQFSTCLVLIEPLFGGVCRLANVQGRQRAGCRDAIAGQLDDVDGVGLRRSLAGRSLDASLRHFAGVYFTAASPRLTSSQRKHRSGVFASCANHSATVQPAAEATAPGVNGRAALRLDVRETNHRVFAFDPCDRPFDR